MFKHTLIMRSLVAGLAVGAASFPAAAQARYADDPPLGPHLAVPVSGPALPSTSGPAFGPGPTQPAALTSTSAQSGFQWGDAGIGAAGTVVLLGAGAGAASGLRRRRVQRVVTG